MRRTGEADDQRDAGTVPPLRAFLGLIALLVVVGAVVLFTREDPAPAPIPTPRASQSPDFSLTDEEAIARFKELHALSLKAGRTRDLSLVDQVFSRSGPTYQRAVRAIERLLRDEVK